MFRGIGAAEKNILVCLHLLGPVTVADVCWSFPDMASKTVRRAMRSLAAKGGARLVETPPMTVHPIRQAPPGPAASPAGTDAAARDPAGSRARAGSPRQAPTPRQAQTPSPPVRPVVARPGPDIIPTRPRTSSRTSPSP
jgi:hypothetical protein